MLQSRLPVQAVFFEQIFGAALLGGNVDLLLVWVRRFGVRKLDKHHLGAAKVLADGNNEHPFADLSLGRGVGGSGNICF